MKVNFPVMIKVTIPLSLIFFNYLSLALKAFNLPSGFECSLF